MHEQGLRARRGAWTKLNRQALIALVLMCVACGPPDPIVVRSEAQGSRPNIILLIGDDHGWNQSRFMGNELIQTPNLDRLAREGTVFLNGMSTASTCGPALKTLLTGLHAQGWQTQMNRMRAFFGRGATMRDMMTLPRQLRFRGYESFQAGKFWEASARAAGFTGGTATRRQMLTSKAVRLGRSADGLEVVTDFLDAHQEDPFFLWLAPQLPHLPLDAGPEFERLYAGMGLSKTAIRYYANTTRMDDFFGQVIAMLEARGLAENTLIVYVSDNGWEQEPYAEHFRGPSIGGPKGKLSPYELGFRTPIIFWMPGRIPAGATFDDLAAFYDVHATILDYAGLKVPASHHGFSLRPRIEGRAGASREAFFSFIRQRRVTEEESKGGGRSLKSWLVDDYVEFLRTDEWRYVHHRDQRKHELFNIASDPLEEHDVADEYPEVLAELQKRIEHLGARTGRIPASALSLAGEIRPATARGSLRSDAHEFVLEPNPRGQFLIDHVPAGIYTLTLSKGDVALAGGASQEALVLDLTRFQDTPYLRLEARSP